MNNVFFLFAILSINVIWSQENTTAFEVHQMLYYENEDCQGKDMHSRYNVIYQNYYDETQYAFYNMNSFNDELFLLYFINQNRLIHYEQFVAKQFNGASRVEVLLKDMKDMEDVENLPESKVKFKFLKKENVIKDNRMITAYHFKVKNFERAKEIIYYIDHASSGVPFSFHEGFYEIMKTEGFPLMGNVVKREEKDARGQICTYTLKSARKPNKQFTLFY